MLRRSSRNVKNAVEDDIRVDNPVPSTMKVEVGTAEEDESDMEDEFWHEDDDKDTDKNSADEDSDYGPSKPLTYLPSSLGH